MHRFKSLICLILLGQFPSVTHADWPSWRGADDSGSITDGEYPSEISDQTIRWKTPLPGKGCSTPIVIDETIYLTAPKDGKDSLLAIDWDGKVKWTTSFGSEIKGKHRNGSGSNASPVSDGEAIYVYFKSGTFAAVETDGKIRWQTNIVERFGKDTLFWDHGTSPVLTDQHAVLARMHNGESWLAGFDKKTGKLAWKVARNYETPVECDHGYTSPLVIQHDGKQALLVWGAEHVTIHDATDGNILWSCGGFNPDSQKLWPAIAMPVIVDDVAVIAFGRNDRKLPLMFGVRLNGSGDVTASNHIWQRDDISTFVPSPVAYQGRIYLVRDRGEVECVDPVTGKTIWSDTLPKGRSSYYASPMIANGILYAPREDGTLFIASVNDDQFKLISENELDEPVIGSPVPEQGNVLIRGEKHLYCIHSGRADH